MTITTTVITINNLFTALFPLVCMQASGEHVLGNECVTRALFVAGIFSFFPDWIPRSEVSWSHWAGCWERENPHRWCFKIPPGGEEFFGDALSSIIFFQAYYYCCCCCCCCCCCWARPVVLQSAKVNLPGAWPCCFKVYLQVVCWTKVRTVFLHSNRI